MPRRRNIKNENITRAVNLGREMLNAFRRHTRHYAQNRAHLSFFRSIWYTVLLIHLISRLLKLASANHGTEQAREPRNHTDPIPSSVEVRYYLVLWLFHNGGVVQYAKELSRNTGPNFESFGWVLYCSRSCSATGPQLSAQTSCCQNNKVFFFDGDLETGDSAVQRHQPSLTKKPQSAAKVRFQPLNSWFPRISTRCRFFIMAVFNICFTTGSVVDFYNLDCSTWVLTALDLTGDQINWKWLVYLTTTRMEVLHMYSAPPFSIN